ncbi:MAG: septation protein A [Pseudomonadota bacterium]|uniref:septation protein A n=1 Tax=Thermithiobacillus tepidarius TaxID=929 RepID=UPI000429C006|nr:septation protein A [Thermithiobacillus tepidarius]
MKQLADFLPVLIFFIVYKAQGIYEATAVAIVASVLLIFGQYLWYRRVEPMALVSAALVVVFGGATIWLHDELFIKLKPSLLYALFAGVFLVAQLRGTLIVEKLVGKQLDREIPRPFWQRLNSYWVIFFAFLAVLNLYVAFYFPTDIWVNFKLFGLLGITLAFMLFQGVLIARAAEAHEHVKLGADADHQTKQREP